LSWENDGLRIALAVDTFIYFANIRLDYKWALFSKSCMVYAYNKPTDNDMDVVFWNCNTNERRSRTVPNLTLLAACGDLCVLATLLSNDEGYFVLILVLF
jgi:WD repeat-containing protein 35